MSKITAFINLLNIHGSEIISHDGIEGLFIPSVSLVSTQNKRSKRRGLMLKVRFFKSKPDKKYSHFGIMDFDDRNKDTILSNPRMSFPETRPSAWLYTGDERSESSTIVQENFDSLL